MTLLKLMAIGASTLAAYGKLHTARHAAVGFSKAEWELLTQDELWTASERRKMRAILSECVNVSMTLAGMPAGPLPAEYVAAIVATVVHPCNRIVAAQRVPEAYDASKASGLKEPIAIEMVSRETMISLVMAYSSGVIDGMAKPLYGEAGDDDRVLKEIEAR